MSLVQLELDEKDKENFTELQNEIGKAKGELAQVQNKLRSRSGESKHAELTLSELKDMKDDTVSYEQVFGPARRSHIRRRPAALSPRARARPRPFVAVAH